MSKFETNPNIEFPNVVAMRFDHLRFDIVSNFEFRVSSFSL